MGKLDLIQYKRALDFSYTFYRHKYRKGIKFPYFNYLSSVSNLVIENNGSTDEAIAALIHDYFELEDINKKSNYIKKKFGVKVFNIVRQCSDYEDLENQNDQWLEKKKRIFRNNSEKIAILSFCNFM